MRTIETGVVASGLEGLLLYDMIGNMNAIDYAELLDFATSMASAAAHVSAAGFLNTEPMLKDDDSDVTAVDLRIQRLMQERIRMRFPDHAVIGEEDVAGPDPVPHPTEVRFCWVVDPIDGTRNFARGFPAFSSSIALLENGDPIVAVINDHLSGRMYTAIKGQGAYLNQRRLEVSHNPFGPRTMVALQPHPDGTTFDLAKNWVRTVVLRNLGSTALHLAMLADGNMDGAMGMHCRLWDIAAGALIVHEAGGIATDPSGRNLAPFDLSLPTERVTPFLAGDPDTHKALFDGLVQ